MSTPHRITTNQPQHFDAVVIGARVAGASTAMLLARAGANVLLVDRARRGSDTLSTHTLMRGAVRRLSDWGLLDRIWDAGTPAVTSVDFTYGPVEFTVPVKPKPDVPGLAAPRRTVLDPILVDAAEEAGVITTFETSFVEPVRDRAGTVCGAVLNRNDVLTTVSCDVLIGADGRTSRVARSVGAPVTRAGIHASASCITRLADTDLATDRFHWLYDAQIGAGVVPTNDGHVIFTVSSPAVFRRNRHNLEGLFNRTLAAFGPELVERVSAGRTTSPMRSIPGIPGHFRKPSGPGWALVGDAGYFKDPWSAHGIADAFRDAELVAEACGSRNFEAYERERDERSIPLFEVLERMGSFDWSLDELQDLHRQLSETMRFDDTYRSELAAAA